MLKVTELLWRTAVFEIHYIQFQNAFIQLHCYSFDVYSKKGMEINILDLLSKHYSIKMATAQERDLQPDGSVE